ncbi:hypothetical protein TIFTF001_030471 [Ficus carica]|uniref:Uncharacterized protein n=1 Tax=Ficus carica TaxID=3494 RepID=A0AA88DTR5_FICCA|nr:hypothetical protein TIFTF001_030471 [Ficus carica]
MIPRTVRALQTLVLSGGCVLLVKARCLQLYLVGHGDDAASEGRCGIPLRKNSSVLSGKSGRYKNPPVIIIESDDEEGVEEEQEEWEEQEEDHEEILFDDGDWDADSDVFSTSRQSS